MLDLDQRHRRKSEEELKAFGLRRIDAYVHAEKLISSKSSEEEKKTAKTAAQRKKEERDRLIADQLDQFNVVCSVFPDKRETIARVAACIEDDIIQAAIEEMVTEDPRARKLVLSAKGKSTETFEAATVALSMPSVVDRGLRTSAADVAPLIDAVLNNERIRCAIPLLLDRNLSDSGTEIENDLIRIVETIAARPDVKFAVEIAIAFPKAVHVGKKVLDLLEGRGWIARHILRILSG